MFVSNETIYPHFFVVVAVFRVLNTLAADMYNVASFFQLLNTIEIIIKA